MATDATERAVPGLPPDLSSGRTLTEWECDQRVAEARAAERNSVLAIVAQQNNDIAVLTRAILDAEADHE